MKVAGNNNYKPVIITPLNRAQRMCDFCANFRVSVFSIFIVAINLHKVKYYIVKYLSDYN